MANDWEKELNETVSASLKGSEYFVKFIDEISKVRSSFTSVSSGSSCQFLHMESDNE